MAGAPGFLVLTGACKVEQCGEFSVFKNHSSTGTAARFARSRRRRVHSRLATRRTPRRGRRGAPRHAGRGVTLLRRRGSDVALMLLLLRLMARTGMRSVATAAARGGRLLLAAGVESLVETLTEEQGRAGRRVLRVL